MRTRLAHILLPCALIVLMLSACGGDGTHAAGPTDGSDASLPGPQAGAANGSVTGMPDKPGPGPIGADLHGDDAQPPGSPFADDGSVAGIDGAFAATDAPPAESGPGIQSAVEPSVQDALDVIRDYYAAINARQYDAAHGMWSDNGRASGQTPRQFANGFDDTVRVQAQPGEPSPVDAAAGSRYIQVPISITATQSDGSVHRYAGSYILRRAVVDGASDQQRAWHITSADIREIVQ